MSDEKDKKQVKIKEEETVTDEVVYDTDVDSDNLPVQAGLTDTPEGKIAKLKEKIKVLEAEKNEYMNGWQRERADFVNFKKRAEEERKDYIKFANESLLEEMLTVLESFDMAFMNKEQWNSVPENWRVGVEYIHSQLVKILDDNGLKEFIPKVGDKFDPKLFVAEEVTAVEKEAEDGLIKEIKKKGYMMNSKIIIAPKVTVGEFKK
ncbi:MAG: nucleotide exchange factor GrpE [Candidatus Taylorbacteria bacterium RIFOXYD2_FULL_36_9]|uniref:Protein GrpE n=1 Tax=Candidatus Taylorbacteria bacterium RIFOXYD2_FULL_36_9 TaxID=1802338 RepID=A0A1G2PDW1_9BACT|nr:MAG: nucleotide exchange factor GrpE [Candidatus Taylorbacteria bacterium RIFOXYD2_FULL_36_9]